MTGGVPQSQGMKIASEIGRTRVSVAGECRWSELKNYQALTLDSVILCFSYTTHALNVKNRSKKVKNGKK